MTSMKPGRRFARRATFAVALGLVPNGTAATQSGVAEACAISAGQPRRLELPDGRIVSVDAKSVAASGGSIMALGPYVYTFPGNATPTTSPLPHDSLVGVLIEANGLVRLVPSPMRERSVVFARAVAGSAGSFHVVWITGGDSVDSGPAPDDTATIWYAQYANGKWGVPHRVEQTRGAALNPEFTSELLARSGSLSLVFPFVDHRSAETSGGLVALRRRNGTWSSDTLRTYLRPPTARAEYAGNDSLVVLFSQSVRGARAEDVYLSRVGDAWTAPTRIGGNGVRPISDASLVRTQDGFVASWGTWQWLYADSNVLEWTRLGDGRAITGAMSIDSGRTTYPFELVSAANGRPLWLYQGEPYGSTVTYALAVDGNHMLRGHLTIPFHNSRPQAVTLSPERIVVLTMKRGTDGAEPMIASWMTDVRIRCPSTERR